MISGLSVLYFALVMPIGRGTDEAQHAFRAYQLATGHLFPEIVRCASHPHLLPCRIHYPGHHVPGKRTGGSVSFALYQVYSQLEALVQRAGEGSHFDPDVYAAGLVARLGAGPAVFAHFENTALYSPANYLPQTLIFWIGRQVSASVVGTVLAARFLTGFVWAALVTAAVAIVPRWRWLFAMVVLVPTALAQGAMLATDSSALGLTAIAVAYVLRLADRGTLLRGRELAAVSALCLLLGLLKVPTPILLLAVVAIAWPVLGAGAARLGRLAAVALPGIAGAVAWTAASSAYFVPYRNTIFMAYQQADIDQAAQEHYLVTHLYDVPALLWTSGIRGHLLHLGGVITTIGQDGGAGPLPEWLALGWLAVLAVLAIGTHEGPNPSRGLRISLALTGIVYVLVTALGIYMTWDSVGATTLDGIHGRYFTPALVLLVPLLAGLGGSRLRIGRSGTRWPR